MAEARTDAYRRASPIERVVVAFGVVASVALSAVGLASIPPSDPFSTLDYVTSTVAAVSLVVSGAVLIWRLATHPVGWLLWVGGCLFALATGAQGLAEFTVGSAPVVASWLVLVGNSVWVPAIVCMTVLLPLVFPTGHLTSPRWRIVVAIGIVAVVFDVLQNLLTPFDPSSIPIDVSNPIGPSGAVVDLGNLLGGLSSASGVVFLPLVAASLVLRYRRASGVERAQLKWLAAAVAVAGPALAIGIVLGRVPGNVASLASDLGFMLAFIGFALLPVAIGFAILRYRLYEIDVIIKRTVVYVPLTAILAGVYAATTALFQRVFIAVTGERSDGAVIASTLILATLFTPIKNALQTIVDRRFRDQIDARRQLDAYVTRIATAECRPDPARTLRGFLRVAVGAFDTTGGRAVLMDGGEPRIVASVGTWTEPGAVASVESGGHRLGRIELAGRDRGRPVRAGDTALFYDAARRLGEAIAGDDSAAIAPVGEIKPRPGGPWPEIELAKDTSRG